MRLPEELVKLTTVEESVAACEQAAKTLGMDVVPDMFDSADYAADRLTIASDALNDARKAFAISAYHRWEHAANRGLLLVGLTAERRPRRLMDIGQHLGWDLAPEMSGIQALVNLLKHDSLKQWNYLKRDWPEMWKRAERSRFRDGDGFADAVHLEKADLAFILNCVSESGPPASRIATPEEIADFEQRLGTQPDTHSDSR